MKSEIVKEQTDYKIMIHYIHKILYKNTNSPVPGSIVLGQKYAKFYLDEINEMLSLEEVDVNILVKLNARVRPDLEFIRKDCENRLYWSEDVEDNNSMMSMITDFILTLGS